MNDVAAASEIYQFRVVLRDTSPHLWRHYALQDALGWSGSRPYRFLLRGSTDEVKGAGV